MMLNYAVYTALSLYEENFSKLMLLLDGLEHIGAAAAPPAAGLPGLQLTVVDRSVYTTTVALAHSLGSEHRLLRSLHMKIRVYHDAQVAEVLAYQHAVNFHAFYPYPNPRKIQQNEKRRVNQFLGEWLDYCLQSAYHLPYPRYAP